MRIKATRKRLFSKSKSKRVSPGPSARDMKFYKGMAAKRLLDILKSYPTEEEVAERNGYSWGKSDLCARKERL